MILKQKDTIDPKLKDELREYVYDLVGYMMDVVKELPCGLPEYVYQEALGKVLKARGVVAHKEYQHHPMFMGEPMDSFIRMDFMIERSRGNVIIECKAIENIGPHERQQLFSYMIGTGFPIGILVNFAHYPSTYIERYYFDKKDMTITAF